VPRYSLATFQLIGRVLLLQFCNLVGGETSLNISSKLMGNIFDRQEEGMAVGGLLCSLLERHYEFEVDVKERKKVVED
jgi:hypothetical protein